MANGEYIIYMMSCKSKILLDAALLACQHISLQTPPTNQSVMAHRLLSVLFHLELCLLALPDVCDLLRVSRHAPSAETGRMGSGIQGGRQHCHAFSIGKCHTAD
jgi:hypothetical protein